MKKWWEDHFQEWLEHNVLPGYRRNTERRIRLLLLEYPSLPDEGKSWPEMLRMAETLYVEQAT